MFKWRSHHERGNKITSIFKFQFHVTQASELAGNGLVISIVPAENGKPTAKLERCIVKDDNCCYWENPVFETVKFIIDPKSGKILDRIYYFLISNGSSKGNLIGEFCVNMAEYIGATKTCSISFPFKNSSCDSHFHVVIQRILENGNLRDSEDTEAAKSKLDDRSLRRHFSNGDVDEGIMTNTIVEEQPLRKVASLQPTMHGTRRGSSGSDITLSSSDSSSGLNTPREHGVGNNGNNNDNNKDQISNGFGFQDQQRSQWELAIVPVNDSSSIYSMNSPRDGFPSEASQMGLDYSVERLKADLVALSRRAEVSELELQTLRKQIVKESKKGQDMLREISNLKGERNALRDECEKLNAYRKRSDDFKAKSKFQFEGDPWTFLEEIREELNYEKDISANLRIQLQKTQDANAELILAVQDLEEMLEKNNRGFSHMQNRSASGESAVEIDESIPKCQSEDDEEQKALEELVRQHSDAQETYMLEQKIMDLCSEIEMYRRDKDELEMQMEQLALDYEILKQENHEYCSRLEQSHLQEQLKLQCGSTSKASSKEFEAQREKLEYELEEKSEELSHYLGTIDDLEARNQSLAEEIQQIGIAFKADLEVVTRAKMEQEKRAELAEEALNQSGILINELKTEMEKLMTGRKKLLEEFSGSQASIEELEVQKHNLEQDLEKQAHGFKSDMEALVQAKMEQEQRAIQAEDAVAHCNSSINELEAQISKLESEFRMHSEESSGSLASIKELEAHIQNLEEEMEKQAEGFEADLEVVTRAKVDQEQRAIRAEEALRLMKWKNANTAARIQDEFKRLSTQMQSSFEANEKLASKALTEASELRMQNRHLKDLLQKANEEVQSVKFDYDTKVQELCNQIKQKTTRIHQMTSEIEEKSKLVESEKEFAEDLQKNSTSQQLDLRADLRRLVSENKSLTEQAKQVELLTAEVQKMKTVIEEKDQLLQRGNTGGTGLQGNIPPVEEVTQAEVVRNLQSKVDELRSRCDSFKHSLYEDELEKERLRKQVARLKSDMKKKDDMISSVEKKLKENCEREPIQEKSKAFCKNTKPESAQRGHKEVGSKEVTTLKERLKLLEEQIKSKDTAMETSAGAFLAKERNLQNKIEELVSRLGEQGLSTSDCHEIQAKEEKVSVGTQVEACNAEEVSSVGGGDEPAEASSRIERSSEEFDSNGTTSSETQPTTSDHESVDKQNFDILLKEMVLLKERNNSMEIELKEMQERYSEISLKFAEVEGERQQLVMRVRNLKNKRT